MRCIWFSSKDLLSSQISPLLQNGWALYDDRPSLFNAYLSSLRDASQEESDSDPYTCPYNFSDEYRLFYVNSGCSLSALKGYLKQANR
jgi:hypothetical protein